MVGLLTFVIKRVDSVTSTSLRVNFGDMRTFSGPMFSGAFEFLPQSGDCLITPLTQVAVLAQGTITS